MPKINYKIISQSSSVTVTEVYIGRWYIGKIFEWPHTNYLRFSGFTDTKRGAISMCEDYETLSDFEATLAEDLK